MMSYYQKYRPRKIAELDLDSVREVLLSSLKAGNIAHAYLFVGPRGAGKTSTARILTQVVNCKKNQDKKEFKEACGECEACKSVADGSAVDILEMDAASHRGIDDIRDLRDKIRLTPVALSKKVYIIDEVHMLTNEAFNALLKTLEEPPEHAMFFLCTTELQKVPETILSRCLRVNFTKATKEEILRSLNKAVVGEKLEIENEALEEIAEATDGSFREGHKLLEQVASVGKKIDVALVKEILGLVGKNAVKKLLDSAIRGEKEEVVKIIKEMENSGVKASVLLNNLLILAREEMETKIREREFLEYAKVMTELIAASEMVKYSPLPLLPVELALLKVENGTSPEVMKTTERVIPATTTHREDTMVRHTVTQVTVQEEKIQEVETKIEQTYTGDPTSDIERVKQEWHDFLNNLAHHNASLAGLLRSAAPLETDGKYLTLEVFYPFHKDQLDQEAKKKIIEAAIAKVWGPLTVKCILGSKNGRLSHEVKPVIEAVVNESAEVVVKQDSVASVSAEEIFGV